MTISYSDTFFKLLVRWDGSLWKGIWRPAVVYLFFYYSINIIYRFLLNNDQKVTFLQFVDFCEESSDYIPLNFVLGFFVSAILARWWSQCNYISYPDASMLLITTYIQGETYLVVRRTMARWLNLTAVLGWRTVCSRTLSRFPTYEHVVKSGLMTESEFDLYDKTEAPHGKWFLPLQWLNNLLEKCREHDVIDSVQMKSIAQEVYKFRLGVIMLKIFEWVSIPLAYTQVVTVATYGYFVITLFSRQITGRTDKDEPDILFPIFTVLQLLFYLGWFKVGEDLINPLGDDDDDFELNYVLDRNVQIAHLLADGVHGQLPPLQKDLYWGQANPHVPYTKASMKHKDKIFNGHLAKFSIPENEQATVLEGEGEEVLEDKKRAFLKFGRMMTSMKKFSSSSGKKNSKESQHLTEAEIGKPQTKDNDPNRFSYISTSSQPAPVHFTYTEDES